MKAQSVNQRFGILAAGLLAASVVTSSAVPVLQLYIEGATYDTSTETWVGDFNDGDTLRVWTIGNLAGGGGKGTISDVKLAIAYDSADTPTFNVASFTTGGYGGFTDPSPANAATFSQTVTDGSNPQLSNGNDLPSHGIYGAGTSWTEYQLGDFDTADSMGGDFMSALPTPTVGYDINVYEITVTGTSLVHFDLYDSIVSGNDAKAKFAPFSHDAEAPTVPRVPDGGSTLLLLGLALVGLGTMFRKMEIKTVA